MQRIATCLAATTAIIHSAQWYEEMQIGPAWANTFEDSFQGASRVAALKGVLIDLGDDRKALFDTETLRLVTSYQGGLEWGGTPWSGAHGKLVGLKNGAHLFNTATDPGWADAAGSFEDRRPIAGFGNLAYASYNGHFRHGSRIVLDYTVHGTRILEALTVEGGTLTRSLKIAGGRSKDLILRVADEGSAFTVAEDRSGAKSGDQLGVTGTGGIQFAADAKNPGRLLAKIPQGGDEVVVQIALARGGETPQPAQAPDFNELTSGGPPLYPEILESSGTVSGDENAPYVTDTITLPAGNPWKSNLRFGAFDFIDDDSAALSTWNGDVWVVRGLKGDWQQLKWQRIASGLFEPLGLRVVNGVIHVNGRDQITQLIDLNGDGETDQFKVFNRDVIISQNFHEFAFDLQTDGDGNFYFSKGSPVRGGGRGFDQILPHHGIVAKIPPDGKGFEVVATGLRAPGGLGIGPNGEITTGENEGTWQPCCKINYFMPGKARFLGTEDARQSLADAPYTQPLAYLPMDVDNSGGSQVWVPEGGALGLRGGELLHLSYGKSSIYRVLPVTRGETLQGGVTRLPIGLQSSAMRARFHGDGSLYVIGFRGWQTNAASESAFHRVRHNPDQTVPVPEALAYTATGVKLTFPMALDEELAADPASYSAQRWDYVRGPQYGSGEFSVDNIDEQARKEALEKESLGHRKRDNVEIESVSVSADRKTVELVLAGMKPSMQLKVAYDLEDENGKVFKGDVHATVFAD